jgi:hypothetical protein
MASSRDTLVAELKYIMGNRDDLDSYYPNWIRRAYAHIAQIEELPENEENATINMILTQRSYSLPSDFFSIYTLRNVATDTKLFQVSPGEYAKLMTSASGHPDRYTIFKKQLYVHPTPAYTDTLDLNYWRFLPDLTLGSSVHLLPDAWDQPIIHLGAAFGFDYTNEIERAAYYRRVVAQFIREQRSRIASNLYDRSEPLAPIGGEIK